MSTDSSVTPEPAGPDPDHDTADHDTAEPARPGLLERLGADWAAVVVAGALVVLAGLGLLPSIPFLIK